MIMHILGLVIGLLILYPIIVKIAASQARDKREPGYVCQDCGNSLNNGRSGIYCAECD